ncbi:tetratricopeptide repeat-containing glycosyltransferase family protein [Roseomonas xinghualingensis]|uniref:tetratricopeptide repeat-containing glycosyltransferase family protein n=1 Tax=Roseomonas xinghualingensis TaxID=2986475 RepID=UPI0021F23B55|nr:tetratricopeptide repeat-containing glycosyltransferase family protein [Roseomonas sp. SXEYE001]MCV4209526.1 tetratricopeptide repeat-containing glycosyltransferase family protein [Roseomonas sp. SXEYE001]
MDAWPKETPPLSTLREKAARLWHEGRAEDAARLYAEVAARSPDPSGDLLWQGHALRSAGAHEAAFGAYSRAVAESPAESAPHCHRGHALWLLGRREEAAHAYSIALEMWTGEAPLIEAEEALLRLAEEGAAPPDAPLPPRPADPRPEAVPVTATPPKVAPPPRPESMTSRRLTMLAPPPRPRIAMLRAGGVLPARAGRAAAGTIAFDVSDLLMHFDHRRTLTGIQRVQASIVGAALRSGMDAAYLVFGTASGAWRAVPGERLSALLTLAGAGANTDDPEWIAARDAVSEAAVTTPLHAFPEGGMLVNLGNSWGIPGYFKGLRAAQRASGLRYVPFLHDCVPLVMPEHCVRTLVQDYARWFAAMGVHAHGLLCNSESTRADVNRFLDALIPGLDLPMEVVRLDGDPRGNAVPDPAALEGTHAPRPPEPYILFVATIESRKDHLTVFRAWLSLLRRHGPASIPRLVCVGGEGWHAEAAMNLLASSPELSRHVVVLHGISDGGLAALYRDCLFTIYNSHYEGWGLPVTESLAWGKVPVVPRHSALVESGAGAAVFIEPQSERDMTAAVERLLFEPGTLFEAERAVAALGPCRSWEAVLGQVVSAVERFGEKPAALAAERMALPLGQRLSLRRTDALVPDLSMVLIETVREGAGWRPPEDWGSPLAGSAARLRLPLPPDTSGLLRLHLELRSEGGGRLNLALFADSRPAGSAAIQEVPAGDFATAVPVEVAEGTRLLELELDAPPGSGLRGLMLCKDDDLLARLDFLEAQRLPHPSH